MKNVYIAMLVVLVFWSCRQEKKGMESTTGNEGKRRVTVSILPQQYFVRRIAGEKVAINIMIPPGHSPAVYEPTPQQMKNLSDSEIYFRIGHIPFEKAWMGNIKSANPKMKIVDTSAGVKLIYGDSHQEEQHHHGAQTSEKNSGSHNHKGVDPHIWLSPVAVKIQAKNILKAFLRIDPENRAFYENNYQTFTRDIDLLYRELNTSIKELQNKKIMVFHPAWGYLARDFNLVQIAIEAEGKEPSPAAMKRAIDTAREEGIRIIFVQKQFATHSAGAVANEIDGKVIVLDPLAPDWLDNMKKIGETLKEAL